MPRATPSSPSPASSSIKIPATEVGIAATEEAAYRGVSINATVSFTVPQAVKRERVMVDPGILEWAGVAALENAYRVFIERGNAARAVGSLPQPPAILSARRW